MFAWAKNAPPTTLPQGVSFLVDPGQRRYLVLQVESLIPSLKAVSRSKMFSHRFITRSHCLTLTIPVSACNIGELRQSIKLEFFSCYEGPCQSHQTRQVFD